MTQPSAENQWELTAERLVPCKRHHAYRMLMNNIHKFWWPPLEFPIAGYLDPSPGRRFYISDNGGLLRRGTILATRPGWTFEMTDGFFGDDLLLPSIVVRWSFSTTSKSNPNRLPFECSTYASSIRHFSEDHYQRNLALGIEQKWEEAADLMVDLCTDRARHYTK